MAFKTVANAPQDEGDVDIQIAAVDGGAGDALFGSSGWCSVSVVLLLLLATAAVAGPGALAARLYEQVCALFCYFAVSV